MNQERFKFLEWDSKFYEKSIYSLTLEVTPTEDYLAPVKNLDYDLVYIICENPSDETLKILERSGAKLYDKKVTFSKDITVNLPHSSNKLNFESHITLNDSLENMVYQSGIYSRFYLDPKLRDKYEEMYKTWIKKSLTKELANEVLIAKNSLGEQVGFLTLIKNERQGKIGLIAVDTNYRGQKFGVELLCKADEWYKFNNIETATVVTQLDNIPACNLYKKMGYQINKMEYIYHLWKS